MHRILAAHAANNYMPLPSIWGLRKRVCEGEISPMPELVSRLYHVDEEAIRVTVGNVRGRVARNGS